MNAQEIMAMLPDVQSRADDRALRIEAAGIKGLRAPVTIRAGEKLQATVATFCMTVGLPEISKGTHMSRFIEVLETQTRPFEQQRFKSLVFDMLARLEAQSGMIEMRFPYFVRKTAPVSGVQSQLDCDVCWRARVREDGRYSFWMHVAVPATSLCPCSKEISAYGAHNQRSQISIETELVDEMAVEELIAIAERNASCEVYGLLKRADEKHVTERAYDNPKFVEDLVRDVALELRQMPCVRTYVIEAENFESIHNHSAFARLVRQDEADPSTQCARRSEPRRNLHLMETTA